MSRGKAVRHAGRIRVWNDDRGFGFIEAGKGREVFVHIKDFPGLIGRPEVGQEVTFELGMDERKRRRAKNVEVTSGRTSAQREKAAEVQRPSMFRIVFLICGVAGMAFWGWTQRMPIFIPVIYLFATGVSAYLYAQDKAAAGRGAWRVSEGTLHLCDLLGGWPGGLITQVALRHKTKKASFQGIFWLTVLINLGAFAFIAITRPFGVGLTGSQTP